MLINKRVEKLLNVEALELKTFKDKSLGLIKFKNKALFLKTRFGIHTFLVKSPIDVVILDKDNRIKKIKEKLLPNRVLLWNPKYFRVLELPPGTIKKLNLKLNNILKFSL